jgi:hypothetical protein
MPRSSTIGAMARTAALKAREYLRYSSKSTGSSTGVGREHCRLHHPMAEKTPSFRAS